MKFCLERGSLSGRRARPWDLVLRSWPVDLIGGRRPCNTWYRLPTMAEKRVSSACPQSSDNDGVDGDKNPSLWALVKTACMRCLSDASVKPRQTGEAYSRRLISMACPTSQSAMPLRPCDFNGCLDSRNISVVIWNWISTQIPLGLPRFSTFRRGWTSLSHLWNWIWKFERREL